MKLDIDLITCHERGQFPWDTISSGLFTTVCPWRAPAPSIFFSSTGRGRPPPSLFLVFFFSLLLNGRNQKNYRLGFCCVIDMKPNLKTSHLFFRLRRSEEKKISLRREGNTIIYDIGKMFEKSPEFVWIPKLVRWPAGPRQWKFVFFWVFDGYGEAIL